MNKIVGWSMAVIIIAVKFVELHAIKFFSQFGGEVKNSGRTSSFEFSSAQLRGNGPFIFVVFPAKRVEERKLKRVYPLYTLTPEGLMQKYVNWRFNLKEMEVKRLIYTGRKIKGFPIIIAEVYRSQLEGK